MSRMGSTLLGRANTAMKRRIDFWPSWHSIGEDDAESNRRLRKSCDRRCRELDDFVRHYTLADLFLNC